MLALLLRVQSTKSPLFFTYKWTQYGVEVVFIWMDAFADQYLSSTCIPLNENLYSTCQRV